MLKDLLKIQQEREGREVFKIQQETDRERHRQTERERERETERERESES